MCFTGFVCIWYAAGYPPDRDLLLCPACGNLLDARYDLARIAREVDRDALCRRPSTVWRWLRWFRVHVEGKGEGLIYYDEGLDAWFYRAKSA